MSTSIAAHPDRSLPTDPATREIARNPLEQVEDLPIVFPHGHVDARIIAENTPFPDPAQLLISPDHHVTRLTHANGVGMGLLNTMTWALKADTMEYGEYKTGIHTEGATYSAVWFTRKMGQAIASYALAVVAFDQHAPQQSPDTVNGMAVAGGVIPAVVFLIVMLIMAGYPLTEAKFKDIMKSIEANRSLRHE